MNTIHSTRILLSVAILCGLGVESLRAENWPNWRGPQQNGTASEGDYPLQWGAEENVAWRMELTGRGASTPIVWQDRIILTVPIDGKNGVICLDRTGQKLWQATVGEKVPGKHRKGTGTNPSPVTDGETIFVYFKSGDFAALDFSGMVLWQQNLQEKYAEDTLWWDLGTSPVLTSRHVIVACMQTGPSYVAAFDKKTGEEAWKVDRNLGAPEEAAQSYSTPVVVTHEGQEQIIVLGADHVTCHDAADGREIWRVGGFNPDGERFFRSIASPVVTNDIVIAPYARGNTLTAIRMGGEGDVTESHVLWRKSGLSADVPTPVARDGKVYVCTDRGTVGCLDAETGEELWTVAMERNRNNYSASPILVGDRLYLIREDGTAFVIDVNEQKVVSTNTLKEDSFVVATPVFVGNEILIRTFEELFSIRGAGASVSSQ
jgi:outer membrane protein assembly factor BamB